MSSSYYGLTSAVATVSELQAQRRQGWDRAGTPDWGRWWLSVLAVENRELTGTERRKQSGDLLPKRQVRSVSKAAVFNINHQETQKGWSYLSWAGWSEDERIRTCKFTLTLPEAHQ